jgi:hypothetical protein
VCDLELEIGCRLSGRILDVHPFATLTISVPLAEGNNRGGNFNGCRPYLGASILIKAAFRPSRCRMEGCLSFLHEKIPMFNWLIATLLPYNFAGVMQPPCTPAPLLPDKQSPCKQRLRALGVHMLPCLNIRLCPDPLRPESTAKLKPWKRGDRDGQQPSDYPRTAF